MPTVRLFRFLQPEKAPYLKVFTLAGSATEANSSHQPKVQLSIVSTPSGITTEVNTEFANAANPIFLTLVGIVIEVKFWVYSKA